MRSYFFNAEPSEDMALHPTGYDRAYDADDYARYFAPFFSVAGVMPCADPDACKVVVQEGNTLRVCAGSLYVKGRMCGFDGDETVTVEADSRVVARMNKTADVRAFQLLAIPMAEALTATEDIYDLELATVAVTPVMGGFEAVVTDTRTFLSYMGQPAYYPPTADNLPYVLWLYTLGFPMSPEQRAMVTGNPSLMSIYHGSLGAARSVTVPFTAASWTRLADGAGCEMILTRAQHERQTDRFCYTVKHNVGGALKTNTWGARCTDVRYDAATGNIRVWAEDPYAGEITFTG